MPATCKTVVKPMELFETAVEGIISQPGAAFTVYKARDKRNRINMAIKMIPLKDPDKRSREIAILESLRGCPNIAKLLGSISTNFLPSYAFLTFEYVNCVSWYNMHSFLSLTDLKGYLYQLITALVYCHDRQVVHRSVKPDNLLIDPIRKHLQLSGWSNAVVLNSTDHSEFNPLSYEYLSPELLLRGPVRCFCIIFETRDKSTYYSVDLWPVGCMIASIVLSEPVLFYRAKYRSSQLATIIKVVGKESIMNYIQSNKIQINPNLETSIFCSDFGNYKRSMEKTCEVVDLMFNLMTVDPFSRITARQALSHPFFSKHHPDQTGPMGFTSRSYPVSKNNSSASTGVVRYLPYFDYKFISCIGEGSYGHVHRVQSSFGGPTLAVKIMKRNNREDFANECVILEKLRGAPNVVKFYGSVITNNLEVLVFEFVDYTPWKHLYNSLKSTEIQYYIYSLLLGLQACHGLGIMHRDIKPSNLVINPARRQLRLVDWGQAIFYCDGKDYDVSVGTSQYRSPEMHLGYARYNFAVDMWPVGCILASAIFRQRHMFPGRTKKEVLLQIIQVVGSATMLDAIKKYGSDEFKEDKAFMNIRAMDFQSCVNASNKQVAIKSAVDLVSKLLVCDPEKRYTAAQALRHSYLRRAHQFPGELVI
nr:casein kinase ii subunit alpha [Hymenolepis microstoma]